MAIDPTQTNLSNVNREQARPLPANEILTTPETIQQLQIPDAVALRPENVIPFLANQSVRLKEITERPEIKAMEGDIPEYLHSESAPVMSPLSSDEQSALGDWRKEALLQVQSGSSGIDGLESDIKGYISDVTKNHPELFQQNSGSGTSTSDIIDQYMTGQMVTETAESKKKYQQMLALAASSGNPDDVILAMTYRQAQDSMVKVGQLMGVYKAQSDDMDKLRATLDLDSSKSSGLSQATMMKDNMSFSKTQGDMMNLFQIIQKEMNNYEQVMQGGASEVKATKESRQTILGNYKS